MLAPDEDHDDDDHDQHNQEQAQHQYRPSMPKAVRMSSHALSSSIVLNFTPAYFHTENHGYPLPHEGHGLIGLALELPLENQRSL